MDNEIKINIYIALLFDVTQNGRLTYIDMVTKISLQKVNDFEYYLHSTFCLEWELNSEESQIVFTKSNKLYYTQMKTLK